MATPQPGYPPHAQPGYDANQQEQHNANQHEAPQSTSPVQGSGQAPSAASRKKRHYAGQAYDFGAGANSALGGQQQGGAYPPPPGAGYGSPVAQPGRPGPAYGSGPASPPVGAPYDYGQKPAAVGGYQSPDPGYPTHGAPPGPPGVGGITQGMGNMAMGGHGQHQTPQMQGRPPMNQLYPTDLLNQPLNVSELDLPPPPIILPPNVSKEGFYLKQLDSDGNSPA